RPRLSERASAGGSIVRVKRPRPLLAGGAFVLAFALALVLGEAHAGEVLVARLALVEVLPFAVDGGGGDGAAAEGAGFGVFREGVVLHGLEVLEGFAGGLALLIEDFVDVHGHDVCYAGAVPPRSPDSWRERASVVGSTEVAGWRR